MSIKAASSPRAGATSAAVTGTFFNFGGDTTNLDDITALLQSDITTITIDGVAVALNAPPYNL